MNRKEFLITTSLGIGALSLPFKGKTLGSENKLPNKNWLHTEPIIMVGCWDSFPLYHIRRQDGNPDWFMDLYKRQQSEDTIRKLADIGITMAIIHFYKGFGLKAEQDHMKDAKRLTELCHKHGMRVGVYIGSTIFYETFLIEKPEAEKWFVPPYLGHPSRYGDEEFRKLAYFMYPEYVDYLKNVIRIAIEDYQADLLHFDNTSLRGIVQVFQHPLAKKQFVEYLNAKYKEEDRKKRFGITDFTYVEPPFESGPFAVIDDPMRQEWMNFRCQQLADFCQTMEDYARSLNPGVAVEHNPSSGFNGENTMWTQGIDYPRLLKSMDIAWTEAGSKSHVSEAGILISQIRTYKAYTQLNNKVFTYTNVNPVKMAEAMAFNRQCLGWVGDMFAGSEMEDVYRRYIRFYLKYFKECYQSVHNIADAAVLHTYATMAHNQGRPYQSTLLFEQTLIQGHILFDIIFDEHLDNLSKYKVLILADQESLSDGQIEKIRDFVKRGGGLVVTEHSSLYKPPHRRRSDFGLKDIMQVSAPKWPLESRPSKSPLYPEPLLNTAPQRNNAGKGRVAYIPEVIPVKAKPADAVMTSDYLQLPKNWNDLISDTKWAANAELSLKTDASETVIFELMKHPDSGTYVVHVLNYNAENQKEINNIKIQIRIPQNKKVSNIKLMTPDDEKEANLVFHSIGQSVDFTVPSLHVYDLISIELKA